MRPQERQALGRYGDILSALQLLKKDQCPQSPEVDAAQEIWVALCYSPGKWPAEPCKEWMERQQGWWELNLVLFIWLRDWPHVRLRSPGIEIMSFRSEVRSYTITVKRLSLFLRHPYLSVHSLTLGNYSPTSLPWDCRKASKKTLSITFIKSSNGSSEYTREKWLLSISENYQEAFLGHFIHAEC